jgi:hypothetical protein
VFIGVLYNAQLDADGNPVKGPRWALRQSRSARLRRHGKAQGVGTDYPEDKRNGEWEYRAFKADKTPNEQINLGVCFDCHRPQAKQDYVHSYDNLKTATP